MRHFLRISGRNCQKLLKNGHFWPFLAKIENLDHLFPTISGPLCPGLKTVIEFLESIRLISFTNEINKSSSKPLIMCDALEKVSSIDIMLSLNAISFLDTVYMEILKQLLSNGVNRYNVNFLV